LELGNLGNQLLDQLAQHVRSSQPKGHPPTPRGTRGNYEETRGGVVKVVGWSTKAAISLKRVKMEEKLLQKAYWNSPTLFRTVPSPTPYGFLFPKIGGLQTPPKTPIAIISGTGEATAFKFCTHIHSIKWKKSPLKISGKVPVSVVRDSGKFSGHSYMGCIAWSSLR